jgi:CBS domain-containing protein
MRSGIRAIDMGGRKLLIAKPTETVHKISKKMAKHRIGGMPVVDKGKLIGIVTERDIINKMCARGKHPKELTVKDIMTSPVKVKADKHDDLTHVATKMVAHDVSRIPIVDEDKLVGFITNKDIAREAPSLINVLLEQLRIKDPSYNFEPTSFGKCETCGVPGQVDFRNEKFLCELCAKQLKD